MTVDDRAEELPFLAGEFHHLHLFDRIEICRRSLNADSWNVGVDLEIHVRHHLHHVGAREVVAAPSQHFNQRGRGVIGRERPALGAVGFWIILRHEGAEFLHSGMALPLRVGNVHLVACAQNALGVFQSGGL